VLVGEHEFNENGLEAVRKLMALESRPTAIVAEDDLTGYELLSYLEKLDILVPRDVSIIGFNNLMLSKHSRPPLTSVEINIFQLGTEAANCLFEKIEDPKTLPKRITIPTQLVERESYLLGCLKVIIIYKRNFFIMMQRPSDYSKWKLRFFQIVLIDQSHKRWNL